MKRFGPQTTKVEKLPIPMNGSRIRRITEPSDAFSSAMYGDSPLVVQRRFPETVTTEGYWNPRSCAPVIVRTTEPSTLLYSMMPQFPVDVSVTHRCRLFIVKSLAVPETGNTLT